MLIETYKGFRICSFERLPSGRISYRAMGEKTFFEADFDTVEQAKVAIDRN